MSLQELHEAETQRLRARRERFERRQTYVVGTAVGLVFLALLGTVLNFPHAALLTAAAIGVGAGAFLHSMELARIRLALARRSHRGDL